VSLSLYLSPAHPVSPAVINFQQGKHRYTLSGYVKASRPWNYTGNQTWKVAGLSRDRCKDSGEKTKKEKKKAGEVSLHRNAGVAFGRSYEAVTNNGGKSSDRALIHAACEYRRRGSRRRRRKLIRARLSGVFPF